MDKEPAFKVEFGSYGTSDVPLNRKMYEVAYDQGMSFSQFLEWIQPTQPGDTTGLDAFERQMLRFGIRPNHDTKFGLPASKGNLFFQPGVPASTVLFPEFINRVARRALINEEDVLGRIVASMEQLSGTSVYRSIYIDETQANRTMSQINQYGKFPTVTISWSEKATTLKKYGVKLAMSYEFVRQASLPVIEMLISRIMLQNRIDEMGLALKTLVDGDGETKEGAAITTINLSTLLGSAADSINDLTYLTYLKFLHQFAPGTCDVIIGNVDATLQVQTMPKPSVDPVWFYQNISGMVNEMGGKPMLMNPRLASNISFITYDGTTAHELVGVDSRYALIGYREAGTDLTETQRIIDGQWEEILMSNTVGFANVFRSAAKKLKCDA
jgi:hypothetical protein